MKKEKRKLGNGALQNVYLRNGGLLRKPSDDMEDAKGCELVMTFVVSGS
jgi:hypothetical protein